MKASKIAINLVLALGLMGQVSFAQAGDKIATLDRLMYTINPKIEVKGPVFNDKSTFAEKNTYVSQIQRLIIKEADKVAKKYLDAGDTSAYYAFMTLAITVPMHEGLYIQYRTIDENVCRPMANSGELIQKTSMDSFNLFQKYLKSEELPFIPNCEALADETSSKQIIRGGDGSDLSIMQVSVRWHADDFLANKKYEDITKTIQYGLGLLIRGFDPVYRNIDKYSCLYEKKGFFGKKQISYTNLIRGVWAGKYNSGTLTRTCRFSDFNSPYKKHDENFQNNLNKILNFTETLDVDIVGRFIPNREEQSAVREIVSNLLNKTNNREALKVILE